MRKPLQRSSAAALAVGFAVLLAATACEPAPPPEPPAGSALVGCSRAGERIELTATSHLDPDCTYTGGFDIRSSGVTLDCLGATVRSAPGAGGRGILVEAPAGVALHDVTVRNCRVEGFLNSLRVTRQGFRDLAPDEEYDATTANIRIEGNDLSGSRGVGIFVDGYVSGVTVTGNQVHRAGSSGIYLETGSRRSAVTGNVIFDNGFTENGPGGQPFSFAGVDLWFWGVGREGISVDGSYENTIRGNVFSGNSAGGVFLYKNCGEYPDRPAYFERRYPAARNLVEGNVFLGGRNGVWVGSRMGENTLPMDCTDPAYVDEPLRRVVLDHAPDNVVSANTFHRVEHGIRVEDDGTRVEGNAFDAPSPDHHAVIIGTPDRTTVLDEPVAGTELVGNVSTIAGNTHPYRWVHGEVDTTVSGNVALGAPVGICEGAAVPRQPFIFVIAVAPAGPDGGPPATTPDLTVPGLGALPSCAGSG